MSTTTSHTHYIIYKPYGYLSQFVNNGPKKGKKKLLGALDPDFPEGLMAIGRLDEKSEGLLLLTTDGKLSDYICRIGEVSKEYYAQLDGAITDHAIDQLRNGIEIGIKGKKYTTQSCVVHRIAPPLLPVRSMKIRDARHGPTSWISITIKEGKHRQVRKMTSAVGFSTLRLVRVRVGSIELGTMHVGETKKADIPSFFEEYQPHAYHQPNANQ